MNNFDNYVIQPLSNGFKNIVLDNILETLERYECKIIGEDSKYYIKFYDKDKFGLSKERFIEFIEANLGIQSAEYAICSRTKSQPVS